MYPNICLCEALGGKDFMQKDNLCLLLDSEYNKLRSDEQRVVYNDFYKFVYGPIIFMVKDHALTEDIIQESFLKIIVKIPSVDNENKFLSWIRVVVKNTTLNFLRKNKKLRNELGLESVLLNDESVDCLPVNETIENEVELKIMAEAINSYLVQLKPESRVLIELRWRQSLSYKEIADYLGIDEQTVKYKLHRARETVKNMFLKDWGGSK